MAWTNLTLTVDGRNALNQAQFDNQLNFKSIVVGDGTAPANFRTQKKLVHQLYELTDLKIDKTDSGCTLTADFPKADYDYYFREVGIIVTTKEGDKLYVYDNCGEDAQYIVSSTGAETTQKRLRLALVISDVENITISEPSILYVAYDDYEQTILKLNQTKVDKVEGKGLSTNDYTNADKKKLDSIEEKAEANVQADWNESNSSSDAYIKNKPQSMKNPTSLNISLNGISQGAYDGSSQKNVNITAENVGADSSGTAETKVSEHNVSEASHADIRNLIITLTTRLNTLADSDDTTLDQLSEIVAYIKNNKTLIDGITTNKVNVSDIIDNLTSSVTNKPLSAKQGKVLKDLITTLTSTVDGKVNKTGDTMTGTLNSSLSTVSFIDGNAGRAIINSTAGAGAYTMLDRLKSTNGYFTDGVWEGKRVFSYTPKTTVDSSVNEVKYQLVLLDEVGNSNFPGLISASRGNFKGDIMTTNNRSDTLNITVPCSGRIDDNIIFPQHLSNYKTFLGSCLDHNKKWWVVISARHANGFGDGQNYGMYLRTEMTGTGSHGGSLLWNKEMGNASGWLGERVLLDNQNYKDFCLPLSGGTMEDDVILYFKNNGPITGGIRIDTKDNDYKSTYLPAYLSFYQKLYGEYDYDYRREVTIGVSEGIVLVNESPDDSSDRIIIKDDYVKVIDNEISEECELNSTGIQGYNNVYIRVDNGDSYFVFTSNQLAPRNNGTNDLGTNNAKWRNIYATNGTIQTSDRTRKTDINNLEIQKVQAFINGLNPVSYKMIDGTSGRTHYGFIAQDIEELMNVLNMDSSDFAGFIKSPKKITKYQDENGKKLKKPVEEVIEGEYDYALRYDEFMAPLIKVVQEQQKTIEQQQRMIENQQKEIEQIKKDISKIYSPI